MDDTLTGGQRATLRALCDTIVPRIERTADPHGFWARRATDLGIERYVEGYLATLRPAGRAGMQALLDGLAMQDFAGAPSDLSREQILTNTALGSSAAGAGIGGLRSLILMFFYGASDSVTGLNPNWTQLGYPGPHTVPAKVPKALTPLVPAGDLELTADACIVGSGAGGAVIAAELARRGLSVVVLEAGGYYTETDFTQRELDAYRELYWRQGPNASADGNVIVTAGATLGGGTVVNWTNCVRTPDSVRREWAQEFGLRGVDGPEFDAHIEAVSIRIGANGDCSDLNRGQERLVAACDELGWKHHCTIRNADPATYSPQTAGYLGFGDQSGSKRSADKTWLADAAQFGAKILARTTARRVLVEGGRAAGVEATYADPATGAAAAVTVRAPRVIVAAGALESPALLLRSGIGGPAVGKYLRLHPCPAVVAMQAGDMKAWWGVPHAMICDQFAEPPNGYGFLIEGTHYSPALGAAATPWTSGRAHKELMAESRRGVTTIGLLRDHGYGRVSLDRAGEVRVNYAVTDDVDVRNFRLTLEAQVRLAHATGAAAIYVVAPGPPCWRFGDDLEAFIAQVQALPVGLGGVQPFSAHQMGSCRMGTDPQTSVANTNGELHDTPGVWIGDGSAFPSASGANPMITIMALARRTAAAIAPPERSGNGATATLQGVR